MRTWVLPAERVGWDSTSFHPSLRSLLQTIVQSAGEKIFIERSCYGVAFKNE